MNIYAVVPMRTASILLLLLLLVPTVSCRHTPPPPQPEALTFLSGAALDFMRDLIARINGAVPQINLSLQTTNGGVMAVAAVDRSRGDLGLAQSDVVYFAYRRGIDDNPYPHRNLRAIAVLWAYNIYVVVQRDSSFRTISDLKGKRVGFLLPGAEFASRNLLAAHGMSYSDVKPIFERTADLAPRLAGGELDAVFTAGAFLHPALSRANQSVPLRLLPVSRKVMQNLRSKYPFLKPAAVSEPNGARDWVETVSADWLLVCRSQLSEETVYQLTKRFFTELPALATKYAEAALIDPDLAPATPIPLHPGAARYYREREILR